MNRASTKVEDGGRARESRRLANVGLEADRLFGAILDVVDVQRLLERS
mgnify:CR=1 FL=1